MAYSIDRSVVRGEIDNSRRGIVRGTIWLDGRAKPLHLELHGDCLRDIAGCVATFRNPTPEACPETNRRLSTVQHGVAGEITASRKIRVSEVATAEGLSQSKDEPAPSCWANGLYIEWFCEPDVRVIIETHLYEVTVSDPAWPMTDTENHAAQELAFTHFKAFLDSVEKRPGLRDKDFVPPGDRDMNEFEWEQFMRRSDTRGERYGEILEKYMNTPDRDRKSAQLMGWDWLNDALDSAGVDSVSDIEIKAEHKSTFNPSLPFSVDDDDDDGAAHWFDDIDGENLPAPEPNPATKGIHWIDDEVFGVCHPTYKLGRSLGHDMIDAFRAAGIGHDENYDPVAEPAFDMQFKLHNATAKLAGALGQMPYEDIRVSDPGFVIACLKRSLGHLTEALNAYPRALATGKLNDRLPEFQERMFGLRDAIIELMETLRKM
jgi:hypothetical protein